MSYQTLTLSFAGKNNYRLLGRARQEADNVILDWSADGVEFTADCSGTIALTAYTSGSEFNTFKLRVIVDGVVGDRVIFPAGESTLEAFSGIAPGLHTIRIVKDSAVMAADERLISATLCGKEDSIRATAPKKKLLEVIGDSISCGYGVMPTDTPESTRNTASAVKTFGYRAAEALDMDYRLVVKGSLGFVKKAGKPMELDMLELYPYQNRYRDSETRYASPRRADVIVLALGANDKNEPRDRVLAAAREFTETLRSIHGENVPIIYMYGMMSYHIENEYKQLAGEIQNTCLLRVEANRLGAGNHPTLEAQDHFTEKLLELLRAKELA